MTLSNRITWTLQIFSICYFLSNFFAKLEIELGSGNAFFCDVFTFLWHGDINIFCISILIVKSLSTLLTKKTNWTGERKKKSYFMLGTTFILKCNLLEINNINRLKILTWLLTWDSHGKINSELFWSSYRHI